MAANSMIADQRMVESHNGNYRQEYEKRCYEPLSSHKTGAKVRIFQEISGIFILINTNYPKISDHLTKRATPSSPNLDKERMACSSVFSVWSLVLEKNLSA